MKTFSYTTTQKYNLNILKKNSFGPGGWSVPRSQQCSVRALQDMLCDCMCIGEVSVGPDGGAERRWAEMSLV